MLEVQNLVKSFDGERQKRRARKEQSANGEAPTRVFAVNDVSFTVEEGDARYVVAPASNFQVTGTIEGNHPVIGRQSLSVTMTPEAFAQRMVQDRDRWSKLIKERRISLD